MQAMDENYRLVFRGEVLDNQHPAVVKKRLAGALKLTDQQVEQLFSGKSVVVKRSADTKTAARYQGLFKQAGARLRVLPVVDVPDSAAAGPETSDAPESGRAAQPRETDSGPLTLQPVQYSPELAEPAQEIQAPDYSVAKAGVNLVEPRPTETFEFEVDFELAEVGSLIPTLAREVVVPVDIEELEFEVAEVGADIGDPAPEITAVAPDISHLGLVD